MKAETLNCPMCGAAVSSEAPQCLFCSSRLATIACPACFGMMFLGSKHCPRCGARAARSDVDENGAERRCPRCRVELASVKIGEAVLRECERCAGLWVDVESFEQICADREQQAVVLGAASPAQSRAVSASRRIQYVPCPECGQLMNRVNFARCSGVVVDVCKRHGTWFDCNELQQIVEFIRSGGLDAARAKEKQQLADEWQRLRREQIALSRDKPAGMEADLMRSSVVVAARELLKLLRE